MTASTTDAGLSFAAALEAVLVAADRPVPMDALREISPSAEALDAALANIRAFWKGRGGQLSETPLGLLIAPRDALLEVDPTTRRELSRSALALLASITFDHPATLSDISARQGKRITPTVLDTLSDLIEKRPKGGTGKGYDLSPGRRLMSHLNVGSSDDLPRREEAVALAKAIISEEETSPTVDDLRHTPSI